MAETSTKVWIKKLKKAGFERIRIKGGHAQFYNMEANVRVTVSVHLKDQKMNNVINIRKAIEQVEACQ